MKKDNYLLSVTVRQVGKTGEYEPIGYRILRNGVCQYCKVGELKLILASETFTNVAVVGGQLVCTRGKLKDYPIVGEDGRGLYNVNTVVSTEEKNEIGSFIVHKGLGNKFKLTDKGIKEVKIANKDVYERGGKLYLRNKRQELDTLGLVELNNVLRSIKRKSNPKPTNTEGSIKVDTPVSTFKVVEGGLSSAAKVENRILEFKDEAMGKESEWQIKLRKKGEIDEDSETEYGVDTLEFYKKNIKGRWQFVSSYAPNTIKELSGGVCVHGGMQMYMSKEGVKKIQEYFSLI